MNKDKQDDGRGMRMIVELGWTNDPRKQDEYGDVYDMVKCSMNGMQGVVQEDDAIIEMRFGEQPGGNVLAVTPKMLHDMAGW